LRFTERAVRKKIPDPPTGIGAARLSDAVLPDSISLVINPTYCKIGPEAVDLALPGVASSDPLFRGFQEYAFRSTLLGVRFQE
jgi:hypothetical protein